MPEIYSFGEKLKRNIAKVIVGKDEIIEKALAVLLSGGHVLINDVPALERLCLQEAWPFPWVWTSGEYSVHPTFFPAM
jgi:hypothetical protein